MRHSWLIWMAIVGLAIMGFESIVVAPASASLAEAILARSLSGAEQVVIQVLLVALFVTVLAASLLQGSRFAYVTAVVIGVVPLAWWCSLVAANDPLWLDHLTVRMAATSLLVLTGLGLDWSAFWHRRGGALKA
jgi:hypothetical protein